MALASTSGTNYGSTMEVRGIRIEDISKNITIPDHPVAHLMYYLYCVFTTIDALESDSDIKRITDFKCVYLLVINF